MKHLPHTSRFGAALAAVRQGLLPRAIVARRCPSFCRAAWVALLLGPTLLCGSGSASAEQADRAAALFKEGRDLLKANNKKKACAKFEESYRERPSAGAALNLAQCAEDEGHLVAAMTHWKDAETLAASAKREEHVNAAREGREKLDARLPRLTLRLPANAPAGALVVRTSPDGTPVAVRLGEAEVLDPGRYRIIVTAPGRQEKSEGIEMVQGLRLERELEVGAVVEHPAAPAPTPTAAPQPPPVATSPRPAPYYPPWVGPPQPPPSRPAPATKGSGGGGMSGQVSAGVVVTVLGVLVTGSAVGLGFWAKSQWNEALSHCVDGDTSKCDGDANGLSNDAIQLGTWTDVAYALGAAEILAGVILLATSSSSSEKPEAASTAATVRWVPLVTPTTAGAGLTIDLW
jgi:hypothetical protein